MPNVLEDIRCRIPDDTSIDVEAQGPVKFAIWVSFAEIYNEYIYDLLEAIPKGKKVRRQPLKLSEDKNGQIFIKGKHKVIASVRTSMKIAEFEHPAKWFNLHISHLGNYCYSTFPGGFSLRILLPEMRCLY